MKQLIFLAIPIFLSCQVPGDKATKQNPQGDSLSIYLTYDIAINSCLISWEKLEAYVLSAGKSGELDVYQYSSKDLIPLPERERNFSFKAKDLNSGEEQLIAMEDIMLVRVDDGFKLVQTNPFDGEEMLCGFIKLDDLIRRSPSNFLQMLDRYKRLPALNKIITGSEVYTMSMLLLDTLQKDLARQSEGSGRYTLLDENLTQMSDSLFNERIHQLEDSLGPDRLVYSKQIRIPEYDLWKGFMAYGSLSATHVSWNAFGLLYHPNTKFGGYNPGRILWFAIPVNELEKRDPETHQFLTMLAHNALLYSADPTHYRSQYYLKNSITIENSRYPGKR